MERKNMYDDSRNTIKEFVDTMIDTFHSNNPEKSPEIAYAYALGRIEGIIKLMMEDIKESNPKQFEEYMQRFFGDNR
jgi:hypothetical protein